MKILKNTFIKKNNYLSYWIGRDILFNGVKLIDLGFRIRSHKAKTFLLTNSEYWYTDKLMTYLLATDSTNSKEVKRDWKSFFDLIIVDAQKPLFFAEGTTLRIIDPHTGSMKLGSYAGQLQQNEVYSGGRD